jgi:hypothetical protein
LSTTVPHRPAQVTLAATGVQHVFAPTQTLPLQSLGTAQALPSPHPTQVPPPQSTSVSALSF